VVALIVALAVGNAARQLVVPDGVSTATDVTIFVFIVGAVVGEVTLVDVAPWRRPQPLLPHRPSRDRVRTRTHLRREQRQGAAPPQRRSRGGSARREVGAVVAARDRHHRRDLPATSDHAHRHRSVTGHRGHRPDHLRGRVHRGHGRLPQPSGRASTSRGGLSRPPRRRLPPSQGAAKVRTVDSHGAQSRAPPPVGVPAALGPFGTGR
jgi:hypothetical protein